MRGSDEWADIPTISYSLSDDEARARWRRKAGMGYSSRLIQGFTAVFWIAIGTFRILIVKNGTQWLGILQIAVGLIVGIPAVFPQERWYRRRRDYVLHFADSGITIGGASEKPILWQSVRSVSDDGDVLLFACGSFREIVVPKRVFADRGVALWKALEAHLIGKRMLQRRPDSRTIVNTALRA